MFKNILLNLYKIVFMSDTKKHKENGKFKNRLLEIDEVSTGTKKGWDRRNFERGYFRNLKNVKIENIQDFEMNFEIDNEITV